MLWKAPDLLKWRMRTKIFTAKLPVSCAIFFSEEWLHFVNCTERIFLEKHSMNQKKLEWTDSIILQSHGKASRNFKIWWFEFLRNKPIRSNALEYNNNWCYTFFWNSCGGLPRVWETLLSLVNEDGHTRDCSIIDLYKGGTIPQDSLRRMKLLLSIATSIFWHHW